MLEFPGGVATLGETADGWRAALADLGYPPEKTLPAQVFGFPAHAVALGPYFLDVHETTNRWWAEFCRDTGAPPPPHWVRADGEDRAASTVATSSSSRPAPVGERAKPSMQFPGMDVVPPEGWEDRPVTWVSFLEAEAFCRWCGARLPTEAEWEAAARAPGPGETALRRFPFGDRLDPAAPAANYAGARNAPRVVAANPDPPRLGGHGKKLPRLTPVGAFPEGRSAHGVHDLAGNAMELTSSPFLAYPGWSRETGPASLPMDDRESFSPDLVVARGGHFLSNDLLILSWMRRGVAREARFESVGFRRAASAVRGKDLMDAMPRKALEARLSDTGAALPDERERSRFPTLHVDDSSFYTAVRKGGWDDARGVPARARWIAASARATRSFHSTEACRGLEAGPEGLLLGWFRTDVPLARPHVPAGEYWVVYRAADDAASTGPVASGVSLRPFGTPGRIRLDEAAFLFRPFETGTTIVVDPVANAVDVTLAFIPGDDAGARLLAAFRVTAAPGALEGFR
ncbi:MAG TPA: SUMF1/EgtB/PvdO family nonheme iron enzyme [Planctomycetota bacterium]|nr:SUMF1/EgtB/PvdO family nonheme iron enzyme [Planctomycetota bacterium]